MMGAPTMWYLVVVLTVHFGGQRIVVTDKMPSKSACVAAAQSIVDAADASDAHKSCTRIALEDRE